jgi:hypothetical protein
MSKDREVVCAPALPQFGFNVGVTGHRFTNQTFTANRDAIIATVTEVFENLDAIAARHCGLQSDGVPIRLHSLLVDGFDQIAAKEALARGWKLVAPLPFGRALNIAINANPIDHHDAHLLLNQQQALCTQTNQRAQEISSLTAQAVCFELAEQDAPITRLFLETKLVPNDSAKAQTFAFAASERVEMAARVMIEQSDLIIGVWDGVTTSFTGGTGHTIALALSLGVPVLWINASSPAHWRILQAPEELANRHNQIDDTQGLNAALSQFFEHAMGAQTSNNNPQKRDYLNGISAINGDIWRPKSQKVWHAYRRVEALFGDTGMAARFRSLRQIYEKPSEIASGSAAQQMQATRALPGQRSTFVNEIGRTILSRFAWADGISARLSDTYRSGMIWNFMFSAFAIVGGIAYLPLASSAQKWRFAVFELALLAAIIFIIWIGQKRRWHGRWFETRRVAEYLRHAPILLALGIARPAHRWPSGTQTSWPEYYVRHTLRSVGLPAITITSDYIRGALGTLLYPYIQAQIRYHDAKAKRLARVHHNLDRLSERLFQLAIASVSVYLILQAASSLRLIEPDLPLHVSKLFTFLGVLLPTFGGAIAGIRYFGDFERFSAISAVTARKLEAIGMRIDMLLKAPPSSLSYAHAADLGHATDDIVIEEIESWQAVFSGKHMTVPV